MLCGRCGGGNVNNVAVVAKISRNFLRLETYIFHYNAFEINDINGMPSFGFLLTRPLDFCSVSDHGDGDCAAPTRPPSIRAGAGISTRLGARLDQTIRNSRRKVKAKIVCRLLAQRQLTKNPVSAKLFVGARA
jgi:hypothetical protein